MATNKRAKRVVGWKENAALPDLNIKNVIAKIDTGANLASIDAADIKIVSRNDIFSNRSLKIFGLRIFIFKNSF